MASLLIGPPTDEHGNVKKIPKVAVYVAGAAFAVTTGLTLLVLPFVKQAAKMNNHVQFLSHRNLARPIAKPLSAMPQAAAATATTGAPTHTPSIPTIPSGSIHSDPDGRASPVPADLSSSQLASLASIGSKRPSPIAGVATTTTTRDSPVLAAIRDKKFNDDEERSLYGALEGEHEYVSPWLGAQALGLATALVVGSAALGMWGVAKVMGVQSMDEFASKMRETLLLKMPALSQALTEPPSDMDTATTTSTAEGAIPVDHEDVTAIMGAGEVDEHGQAVS